MNIYVGNLAKEVSEEDLKEAFLPFGNIESVKVIRDIYTKESKGFGFIEMPDAQESAAALKGLNSKEIKGNKIIVNEARPKKH